MQFIIRPITEEEVPAFHDTMVFSFGFDAKEGELERLRRTLEVDRTACAFDGNVLAGTAAAFSFQLTVPGGILPMAGTTLVAVRPTHRRRGAMQQMMRRHLDDVHAREEPVAGLWASESSIYGRYGYGPAVYRFEIELEPRHADFGRGQEAPGNVRLASAHEARGLLPPIYEELRPLQPGMFSRSAVWWEHRRFEEPEQRRQESGERRYAVYEENGRARGYLQYRRKGRWHRGFPDGTLAVTELVALGSEARSMLWRFALGVDLVTRIHAWNQPLDEILPWLLSDPRRVVRSVCDSLWLRLVDVAAALRGRRYSVPGQLVLQVEDPFCSWNRGTYELEGGPDGAECKASRREPDLRLAVGELGAVFLGGNRFQTLARAGLVEGSPEALRQADSMFAWDPLPWCPEIF